MNVKTEKHYTMAVDNNVKSKLEIVLTECFKKAAETKFKNLNFVFPKNKTPKQFFKTKIETLNKLDVYSQTFLSIHTRAKLALREFQQAKFEGEYLELLRSVLTLPEKLNKPNLKSIAVNEKLVNDLDKMQIGPEIKPEETIGKKPPLGKTKLLKEGITGKNIIKNKNKTNEAIDELKDLEFADENNPIMGITLE